MRFPHGPGFGGFAIFSEITEGLVVIVCLGVIVGLLFLLVRFLLVATKAAELYVARNGFPASTPVVADSVPETVATTPVATTPVATTPVATTPVVTKPTTTRARTPKTPPTA
jgi:hypothetical protein